MHTSRSRRRASTLLQKSTCIKILSRQSQKEGNAFFPLASTCWFGLVVCQFVVSARCLRVENGDKKMAADGDDDDDETKTTIIFSGGRRSQTLLWLLRSRFESWWSSSHTGFIAWLINCGVIWSTTQLPADDRYAWRVVCVSPRFGAARAELFCENFQRWPSHVSCMQRLRPRSE